MSKANDLQHSGNDTFNLTEEMMDCWGSQGYILLRHFLSSPELEKVKNALEHPDGVRQKAYGIADGMDRMTTLVIWKHPGKDVTGILPRMKKMVDINTKLLGDEIYHYHSKVTMKPAHTGGQFHWHQDYGYWYQNGCLFPTMNTCFIAIDKTDEQNGCLEILPGSQKAGRLDHVLNGGQQEADPERVLYLRQRLEAKTVPMNPGDCLIFHSNLLHRSSPNDSDRRRWAMLIAYNTRSNDPPKEHISAQYTPLDVVPNEALLECDVISDLAGKEFVDPAKDTTVKFEPEKQNKVMTE